MQERTNKQDAKDDRAAAADPKVLRQKPVPDSMTGTWARLNNNRYPSKGSRGLIV